MNKLINNLYRSTALQCHLLSIKCGKKSVDFYLPTGENCDMSGAINLAKAINPEVNSIQTYQGENVDTSYNLNGEEWNTTLPPKKGN